LLWLTGATWLPLFSAAASGGCSQATAFLARNGNAHAIETTTLICGLVADGDFASLDVLYIFATDTSAHALLNLVSSSFTATLGGVPTFTANVGFTGVPSSNFIHTGFIPSSAGGHYTQNSGSIGYYNLTSSTAADQAVAMGIDNATWIIMNQGGTKFFDVNDGNFPGIADTQHQGQLIVTRTAASGAGAVSMYRNSSATPIATDVGASSSVPTIEFYILAANIAGSSERWTTDQLSAAFIGGGLTSAAAVRVSNRINAYMTTLAVNVY
jgi:hypothetical protein